MQSDSWAAYTRTWVAEGFREFIKTAVNPHLGIKEERSSEMGEVVRVISVVRKEENIRKEIEDKGGSGTSRCRIRLLLGIVIGCWRHSEPFKQPPITAPPTALSFQSTHSFNSNLRPRPFMQIS
jgi:hypothetical protein